MTYFCAEKFKNKMDRVLKKMKWMALVVLLMAGCYPYPDNNAIKEDLDIAVTAFQDSIDFTSYRKYYLYDSVNLLVNEGETVGPDDPFFANGLDQIILNEIEVQMKALGYQRVDYFAFPEIGVVATALRVDNVGTTGVPGWWWGYPGYGAGYPGFSGGSPPYWYSSFYSYETGSIVIDMRDFSIKDANETYVWTGYINGLLGETGTSTDVRIQQAVKSTFLQSRNFYPREEEK
jgi:hypothetical protein